MGEGVNRIESVPHPVSLFTFTTHPSRIHFQSRNHHVPLRSRSPCSRWPWPRPSMRAPPRSARPPRRRSSAVAATARRDRAEKLLSPTTQLYVRWDGITAHNDAYKKSIWGPVMAGPTGDSIRALIAKGPKLVGNSLLADPLLDGKAPAELKANLADLKHAAKLIDLIADKGVIVGGGGARAGADAQGRGLGARRPARRQDARPRSADPGRRSLLVIVPDAGDQAEVLFSAIRLACAPWSQAGESRSSRSPPTGPQGLPLRHARTGRSASRSIHAAWWVEGKHFVFYVGTMRPEAVIARDGRERRRRAASPATRSSSACNARPRLRVGRPRVRGRRPRGGPREEPGRAVRPRRRASGSTTSASAASRRSCSTPGSTGKESRAI